VINSQLRIIVTGLVGLYPLGGVAWDYFQYMIGLARIGHDVYYHEDTWSWPYHPVENRSTSEGEYSAKFIADFFRIYAPDLSEKWHYLHLHETSFGMTRSTFNEIAQTADLFINVSGDCFIPDRLSPQCVKVFLDTDPGYNQIMLSERFDWSENVERWCSIVRDHDRHFTNAENIHGPDCLIPLMGLDWKTTGRPVEMTLWKPSATPTQTEKSPWTTVMTWNAFKGKLVYKGVEYKSKGSEFEKLIELPRHVRVPLKVAVGGKNAPLRRLASYGWEVLDGPRATLTPAQYQEFVAGSRGEFSIAKHVYVAMRTGWFSYRSACYLAAGLPVVVQDTGFATILPVGEGILPFNTIEEAADAIQEVEANYDRHAKAARGIAEEYFDSDRVLSRLIEEAMNSNC
jgi:hypothetical protein